MNLLILCASEFATKLVAGLSGIIFAGIIVVCVFVEKNKKSSDTSLEAKAKKQNEELKNAPPESKKDKKSKKVQAKESEQNKQEDNQSENNEDKK